MGSTSPLISASELLDSADDPALGIIDATWFAPFLPSKTDAFTAFKDKHIPRAVFLDIDAVAEKGTGLSHTAPTARTFLETTTALGLGQYQRFVIYDQNRFYASARVWWMFRLMGINTVRVLNGGLGAWLKAGGRCVMGSPEPKPSVAIVKHTPDLLSTVQDVEQNLETNSALLVDARPAGRFFGELPEPRAGLPSGHIPGSVSLPASELVTEDGTLLSAAELEEMFHPKGIDKTRPIITSCGSGVAAAVLSLALAEFGNWSASMFDGSWTEWASDPTRPVAKREDAR